MATHDERMIPLADRVVEMTPRSRPGHRPPEQVQLPPGEVLFRQGDTGELIYFVEEGRVELVRKMADGGEELVTVADPGRYFGELAPLFGLQRSATARAGDMPAVVTGYTPRDFRDQASPEVLAQLTGAAAGGGLDRG